MVEVECGCVKSVMDVFVDRDAWSLVLLFCLPVRVGSDQVGRSNLAMVVWIGGGSG